MEKVEYGCHISEYTNQRNAMYHLFPNNQGCSPQSYCGHLCAGECIVEPYLEMYVDKIKKYINKNDDGCSYLKLSGFPMKICQRCIDKLDNQQ